MANELDAPHPLIALQFSDENIAANTTTKLVFSGNATPTNPGFVVPTGYTFQAVGLSYQLTAGASAGEATFNVTNDGTALDNGPTSTITTEGSGSDMEALGSDPIDAAAVVGVNMVTDSSWNGTASDVDVTVLGYLVTA